MPAPERPSAEELASRATQDAEALLTELYDELRRLAHQRLQREAGNPSMQATELVHEAYMRMLGPEGRGRTGWNGRGHFFSAAAQAMRRILVDRARARGAVKRGGDRKRLELDLTSITLDEVPVEVVELDEALRKLAELDPLRAELVSLRFFGGLSQREAAAILGLPITTADRHWAFARAWLLAAMDGDV